jgi:hypothetical protein
MKTDSDGDSRSSSNLSGESIDRSNEVTSENVTLTNITFWQSADAITQNNGGRRYRQAMRLLGDVLEDSSPASTAANATTATTTTSESLPPPTVKLHEVVSVAGLSASSLSSSASSSSSSSSSSASSLSSSLTPEQQRQQQLQLLIDTATTTRLSAYAPYSNYLVSNGIKKSVTNAISVL